MTEEIYAPPRSVTSRNDCDFYHSIDMPGFGPITGAWDLRGRVIDYLGNTQLSGKRVLEVGPASGFLTVEMERLGAQVVAFEVQDEPGWDFVPFPEHIMAPAYAPRAQHMHRIKNSWWFTRQAFGSQAQIIYGNAYDMPDMGEFDVAVLAAVLLHTKAPLQIIEQCALRAKTLVITDLYYPDIEHMPVARLSPTVENQDWGTWWEFSPAFFIRFLRVLGYADPVLTFHTQKHEVRPMDMFTLVATRA